MGPEPQASNTFLPLLPPTVFLKSTNDLLMPSPKQRLMPMLPPHTTVDTTDTVDTVVDPDMVDTVVDTDTVPDTTAVDTDTVMAVNFTSNYIQWRREDPSDELKSFGFR